MYTLVILMFGRLIFVGILSLALVGSSSADSNNEKKLGAATKPPSSRADATEAAEQLFEEIVSWLSSNFDLPATRDHPKIEFASKTKLARIRATDQAYWQGLTQEEEIDRIGQRSVVAVYDMSSKAIFLSDDWIGKSPVDQSVLVHEIVHHLQNLAQLKFECPAAREKVAYIAQDKWLARFGTNLETEFGVDMFTIVISSACM
jgi:hypothetical protein